MHERNPYVSHVGRPNQEALCRAAAGQAHADQAGRKHPGVVDDEQIAGAEERWKIGELPVRHLAAGAVQHKEPAAAALGGRLLRDEIVGQREIEVGDVQ